jgi:hypothetical protein
MVEDGFDLLQSALNSSGHISELSLIWAAQATRTEDVSTWLKTIAKIESFANSKTKFEIAK